MCNPIESPSPSPPPSTEDIPLPPHDYSTKDYSTYNPLKGDPNYNSFEDDEDDKDDKEYPDYEESDQQLSYDEFIKKLQGLIQELHIQLAFTQYENGVLNDNILCQHRLYLEQIKNLEDCIRKNQESFDSKIRLLEQKLREDPKNQTVVIRYLRPKLSRSRK